MRSVNAHLVLLIAFAICNSNVAFGAQKGDAPKQDEQQGRLALKLLVKFRVDDQTVRCVDVSPNGKLLATASGVSVLVWELGGEFPKRLASLKGHTGNVQFARFSPNGKLLATGGWSKTLRMWDVATTKMLWMKTDPKQAFLDAAFTPDGKRLIVGRFEEAGVDILNVADGKQESRLDAASYDFKPENRSWPCVAVSPSGKYLATVTGGGTDANAVSNAELTLWSTETLRVLRRFVVHSKRVHTIAFSPDGNQLATGSRDRKIKLWDVRPSTLTDEKTDLTQVGRLISQLGADDFATRKAAHQSLLKLGHEILPQLRTAISQTQSAEIRTRAGQILKSLSAVQPWLLRSFTPSRSHVHSVRFAPTGQFLASGNGLIRSGQLRLLDLAGGRSGFIAPNNNGAQSISFSPDGKLLVSGSLDGTVTLWQVRAVAQEQRDAQ